MSEKRKWFDPAPKPIPVVTPILSAYPEMTTEERNVFVSAVIAAGIVNAKVITARAYMPPEHRLSYNLRTLFALMAEHDVESVILDGLDTNERDILYDLERKKCSDWIKEVAQSLFNISERYQAIRAFGPAFRANRRKRFDGR